MKYQRLEIEKIEFGEVDFMTSSGTGGDTNLGIIIINGIPHDIVAHQGGCDVYGPNGDGTYYCGAISFYYPGNSNPQNPGSVKSFTCNNFF